LSDEKKRSLYDKYGMDGIKEGVSHGGAKYIKYVSLKKIKYFYRRRI